MAQHKSCKKRIRTSREENLRNRTVKSVLRKTLRSIRGETDGPTASERLKQAYSVIDRAAKKGTIKVQTANRYKSRMAMFVKRLSSAAAGN